MVRTPSEFGESSLEEPDSGLGDSSLGELDLRVGDSSLGFEQDLWLPQERFLLE